MRFFFGGGGWVSVIIRRQFHTEMTPLNDTDGGVMAGSADGYRRIPKRLRVLYCFQFASVSVHSEHILSWALSLRFTRVVMDLWRGGGEENIHIPDGGL